MKSASNATTVLLALLAAAAIGAVTLVFLILPQYNASTEARDAEQLEVHVGQLPGGRDVRPPTEVDEGLVARAGVLVTDNVLLYATAGLALTDIEIFEASSGLRAGQDVLVGFTVGAGVEAKLHGDWTMRLDYAYASFGREVLSGAPVFVDQTVEVDAHLLRLGVTRQFNWSR